MRTTVTLDEDVERMLKEAMHRTRRSFKETLNGALRAAFGHVTPRITPPAFVLAPRSLGLRAGIDPTSLNKLADELEADAFREQHTGRSGHDRP